MESTNHSPTSAANFNMIDIGEKKDTQRRAVASGVFFAEASTISRIKDRTLPKGDVIVLSEVAGIQGAKKTSELLPLCHPLSLTSVKVWHEFEPNQIRVFCEAKTVGKTGVEMEALGGVTAALLCIYDLTKGIDPVLRIGEIQLEIKEGGKTGVYLRPGAEVVKQTPQKNLEGLNSAILVMSDRCFKKEAEDLAGPAALTWLKDQGSEVVKCQVLPDDRNILKNELSQLIKSNSLELIITSGGTGLSPRDITLETVMEVAREFNGREVPGFGELLRADGAKKTEMSWLSRSTAVLIGKTLIVCLPGKPSAVVEGLSSISHLIQHAVHTAKGGNHG